MPSYSMCSSFVRIPSELLGKINYGVGIANATGHLTALTKQTNTLEPTGGFSSEQDAESTLSATGARRL